MKHYCDTIPLPLAEKLKEKGMPLGSYVWMPNGMAARKDEANLAYFDDQLVPYCTYAEVFDWLMENGRDIYIIHSPSTLCNKWKWAFQVTYSEIGPWYSTWHEAAENAIEKALTLI